MFTFSLSFSQTPALEVAIEAALEAIYQGEIPSYMTENPPATLAGEIAYKSGAPVAQRIQQFDWASADSLWTQVQTYQRSYDSEGNLVEHLPVNTSGVNLQRIEYLYDASDRLVSQITSLWNGVGWVLNSRVSQQYDTYGNTTQIGQQNWTGSWKDTYRSEWTFDQWRNKTSYHFRKWDNNIVTTDDSYQYLHTYDEKDRVSETLTLRFEGGQWEEKTKVFLFWDTHDRLVVAERQEQEQVQGTWKWVNQDRYLYQYTSSGQTAKIEYEKADPASTHNWLPFSQYEYTYLGGASNTQLYSEFIQGQWQNVRKLGLVYDGNGLLIENKLELWGQGVWSLWSWNRVLTDYDPSGALLSETHQTWQPNQARFGNLYKFVYEDFLSTGVEGKFSESSFTIFPNPTVDRVFLLPKSHQKGFSTLEIWRPDGRLVSREEVRLENEIALPISLEKLPEGAYFIRVIQGGEAFVRKVVKR